MKTINRRESPRLEIKLRCHVTSPAIWARGEMYTEDLSRNGVLVAWGVADPESGEFLPVPAVGQILTIDVELPVNHSFDRKCIHCQGTVARVARCGADAARVALRVNYMDFRSLHDRMRSLEAMMPATGAHAGR